MLVYRNVLSENQPEAMYRADDVLYKKCPFNYIVVDENTCRPADSNDKIVYDHK